MTTGSGCIVWRAYSWPEQWRLGGGTVLGRISCDPELDLVYYGAGGQR